MPLKVTIRTAAMLRSFPAIQAAFNKDIETTLGPELEQQITSGLSPVAGVGRFPDYSDSYKDEIERSDGVIKGTDGQFWTGKKLRPVNLKVSGAMLKSLRIKAMVETVKVTFLSKFAAYHDGGNPHIPRRPLLPTGPGEKFSNTITRFLVGRAKIIVAKILKGPL